MWPAGPVPSSFTSKVDGFLLESQGNQVKENLQDTLLHPKLPIAFGGAREPEISIPLQNRRAKERRNLQHHRSVYTATSTVPGYFL